MTTPSTRILQTGDSHFGFLFSERHAPRDGIVVSCKSSSPERCRVPCGISVMIEGYSGTGKTILACNLCSASLVGPEFAVIYSLDQSAEEIRDIFVRFGLMDGPDVIRLAERKSLADQAPVTTPKIFVREIRNAPGIDTIVGFLSRDFPRVGRREDAKPGTLPSIIVLDSINTVLRQREDYRSEFERLARYPSWRWCLGEEGKPKPLAKIFTFEKPDEPGPVEEYLCDCVFELKKVEGVRATRIMEIKKTRGQHSHIGGHEFEIRPDERGRKGEPGGIHILPNLHSRSQSNPIEKAPKASESLEDFGLPPLFLIEGSPIKVPAGTATLLWGPPGTYKTWIGTNFLLHRPHSARVSGKKKTTAIFITLKIDEAAVEGYLTDVTEQRRAVTEETRDKGEVRTITAKDPFESPASVLSSIVDEVRENVGDDGTTTVERAVVFGVRRLYQIPAYKDTSWEFLEVLSKFLHSEGITTLYIDWPEAGEAATPMVIDLCANELKTKKREEDGTSGVYLDVRRRAYRAVDESCRLKEDREGKKDGAF